MITGDMFSHVWRKLEHTIGRLDRLVAALEDERTAADSVRSALIDRARHILRDLQKIRLDALSLDKKRDQLLDDITGLLGITREQDVLELIMDALIQLTEAERGFLVTVTDEGGQVFQVARHLERKTLETPEREVSRRIVQHVVNTGRPVHLDEARSSDLFSQSSSVRDLGLRSVLAVPLRAGDEVLGAVYLENRKVSGHFTTHAAEMASRVADRIGLSIKHAQVVTRLQTAANEMQIALQQKHRFEGIVGQSRALLEVVETVAIAAKSDLPLLIQGESGTGKELLARAAHYHSQRAAKPFVAVNCAALPRELLESQMFGHVRGAFTGAVADRVGLFATAEGGTLFLDEIGEMDLSLQPKLLRVLQFGEYRRVGSDRQRQADVRLVAASRASLREAVAEGRFRDDLFYRINAIHVVVPPLRERKEDVPTLATHFLQKQANASADGRRGRLRPVPCAIEDQAMACLLSYDFPGNVRELETLLQRAALFSKDGRIGVDALPPDVRQTQQARHARMPPAVPRPIPKTAEELKHAKLVAKAESAAEIERAFVIDALTQTQGNVTEAAHRASINRSQLQQMLRRHGLSARDFKKNPDKESEPSRRQVPK